MSFTGHLHVFAQGEREVVMTRAFDAPRPLVFEAWTKCALLKRWLGPPGWTLVGCENDLRAGGAYRFVMRNTKDMEMGWGGVYREILPPERFVATEQFDDAWYSGESLVTTAFVELAGRTTVTMTMLYESRAARDQVLKSGMEQGAAASYDRLAEVLASLGSGATDARLRTS